MPLTHFNALRRLLPGLCLAGLLLTGGGAASAQAVSGSLTTLHAFSALDPQAANPDGADPQAALVQAPDGQFYGTTGQGGPNGTGTIFRVAADGTLTTVHAFTARDTFGNNLDGAGPTSLILGGDGSLYGVTSAGGSGGAGTVFRVTTSGVLTTLYSFSGPDGRYPAGPLVRDQSGTLYGATADGGPNDTGTVFRLSAGGVLTMLHAFTATDPSTLVNSDGANPSAGLILGLDARLYGTAATGGPESAGTVFALATDGSGFTMLHAFDAPGTTGDAAQPQGALLQMPDGTLYGTAVYGGLANNGAIFQISPGGAYGLLYSFSDFTPGFFGQNTDGANPEAGLIRGRDGALYGTTSSGGADSTGTLFRVTTSGVLMPLYAFGEENGTPSPDGANP